MKKLLNQTGPLLILCAALLWAFDGLLRRSLFSLPPSTIVFYEHLIGLIIIAPIAYPLFKKEKIDAQTWKALWVISLLSGVLGTLFFTAALVKVNFISISVVFLLQKLQPIFAVSVAAVVLREKISPKYVAWAALAFVAAYFVTFKNGVVDLATGSATVTAALLALGAAFAWGSSTAFSRFSVLRISHTLAVGMRFLLTVPLAFIAMLILGDTPALTAVTPDQVLRLVIIACSTGMAALWIYYKGLQRTEVKVATILEFAFPITAIILDYFFYHTVFAPSQYVAMLVLFFAMYQVSRLNSAKA